MHCRSLKMSNPSPALLLALLACASLQTAAEAAPRAITHEDLWLMPRVAAPAISRDGRLAVFPVTQPSYAPEGAVTDLWLVPTDGSAPPRRLTADKAAESTPVFSHDGRRIAFSAKRGTDTEAQIHVLDLAGGDAQRVTDVATGARAPQFSPDGQRLLFVSNVFADARSNADNRRLLEAQKARKYNARVYTTFPIRNWDKWREPRQPHVFVQDLAGGEARDLLAGSSLAGARGFGGRVAPGIEELDAIWAPDGGSIVFVASRNGDRAAFAFTHTDLWQVELAGGEPRRLTGGDSPEAGDSYGTPRFSGDGSRLFALVEPQSASAYSAARLAAFSWPGAKPSSRVEAPAARAVTSFALSERGDRAWFGAEDAGQEDILAARVGKPGTTPVATPETGAYSNLVGGGIGATPTLIALYDSATSPPEIVRIDPVRGTHRTLSTFAQAKTAALDLAPVEHFWFESGGRRIHNMLVRPPGFDPSRKYPLFVLIHGGPNIAWRDQFVLRWNYHLLAAPGYVVLLTNYTGSTGFGEEFARGIFGDPFRGPANEINAAADEAIRRFPFIDAQRQCAGGASYGGHLANWLQATTTRYRCLVSHAGLVNLEAQWGTSDVAYSREVASGGPVWEQGVVWREQNPIRYAAKFRTPTLVTVGENDFRVPINNTLEYWTTLQRQQVESRLVVFPDENHWILKGENSRYFYGEVHDWLARWLDDGSATPAP
jgi:dipeptidyl aminopeptidase/acylaminoacyl peptidase